MTSAATTAGFRRPVLWREIALGLLVFGLYSVVAGLTWSAREDSARHHGEQLYRLEQALHLDPERSLNQWLAPHVVLRVLANYEYASTYILAGLAVIVYVYRRRPELYRAARTSFLWLNLLAIACFAVYPVTPPRLLAGLGFVDTVRLGRTWGSWGSPLVNHANQLAAMPSLHIAWAVWVSVVLARLLSSRWVQLASLLHVLVTLFVILATANHFLLDAVGGVLLVALCPIRRPSTVDTRVPAADAFFLHVESPVAAQHVGGIALLSTVDNDFSAGRLAAVIQAHLADLPRFRQRLALGGRWRRPRWVDAGALDWGWHVPAVDLTRPDGRPGGPGALHAYVAGLAATPLPRDRPLWRFVAVTGVEEDRAAGVLVMHHVVADGIGTVLQAMQLLEPRIPFPRTGSGAGPGAVRRAVGTGVGLGQLATDGRPTMELPVGRAAERGFGTVDLPLADVRAVAKAYGTRVSDVLLSCVAGGLRRILPPERPGPDDAKLRVAVPLMVREPGAVAEGNLTAAVMMDLPLGPRSESERLVDIARRSKVLHTGTRALASAWVMRTLGAALPPPLHAWFARTVYGGRFFQAIVSNMPGPQVQLSLAGAPLVGVYPILPLAPDAPLAVGALGWHGTLNVGLATDPALVPDADALSGAMRAVFAELARGARSAGVAAPAAGHPGVPGSR